jgi:hypothetical protein
MKKHHAQKLVGHFDKSALTDVCEVLGENYDEIVAFSAGQRIQMRDSRMGNWQNAGENPDFDDDSKEFRIHPDDSHVAFYYVDSDGCVAAQIGDVSSSDPRKKAGNHFDDFKSAHRAAKETKRAWKCKRGFDPSKMLEVFGLQKIEDDDD